MLTKEEFVEFRMNFKNCVAALEDLYGLEINIGNITYNDAEFHTTMVCKLLDDSGEPKYDVKSFEIAKRLLGFKGNHGDTFKTANGQTFKVVNLIPKRPKFPVQAVCVEDGKQYKFTLDTVNVLVERMKGKQ